MHFLGDVVIGDDAAVRCRVVPLHQDALKDLLREALRPDGTHILDGLAIWSHAHVIVDIAEHSVDVESHLCKVLAALAEVAHTEHVGGVDAED